jgi:glycosyltransferase involved in cell wall biosynthesis
MNILMIAPEPIFEPRGTPLSVVGRLKALSDLDHRVDLLTYPMGQDVDFLGLRILRIPRIPGIKRVKIGPSLAKIPLDIGLIVMTAIQLFKKKYDVIHTHEEAGFWGMVFSFLFRIPHIYDMHSSLPQQLTNFRFTESRILIGIFSRLEHRVLKSAQGIITICPDLHEHVRKTCSEKDSVLIENVVDYGEIFGEKDRSSEIRKHLELDGRLVALYAGTFEPYQGLDLLIQSAQEIIPDNPSILFLMVGGHPDQVALYRDKVVKMEMEKHFIFTGQVTPDRVNSYIRCADLLISPRISGTNTPLKIYAYLRSGVPIVATRLLTHTQVLNDEVAVLTDPDSQGFAQGIRDAIRDRIRMKRLVRHAKQLSEDKYSYPVYIDKLQKVVGQAVKENG